MGATDEPFLTPCRVVSMEEWKLEQEIARLGAVIARRKAELACAIAVEKLEARRMVPQPRPVRRTVANTPAGPRKHKEWWR